MLRRGSQKCKKRICGISMLSSFLRASRLVRGGRVSSGVDDPAFRLCEK